MRFVLVWTAFVVAAASGQHELRGKQSTRNLKKFDQLHRQAKARSKLTDEGAAEIDGPDLDDDKPKKKRHPTLKSSDDSEETGPTGAAPTDEVGVLKPIEDDPPKTGATSFIESNQPGILQTPPVPPVPPSSSDPNKQQNSVENEVLDDIPTYSPTEWPTYSPVEIVTTTTSTVSVSTTQNTAVENETKGGLPTYSPTEWSTYYSESSPSYRNSPTYGPTQPWPTYSPSEVHTASTAVNFSTVLSSDTTIVTISTPKTSEFPDTTTVNPGMSSIATSTETTSAVTNVVETTEAPDTSSSTTSAPESTVSSTLISKSTDVSTTDAPETTAATTTTRSSSPITITGRLDASSTGATTTKPSSSAKTTGSAVTTGAITTSSSFLSSLTTGTTATTTLSIETTEAPATKEATASSSGAASSSTTGTIATSIQRAEATGPPQNSEPSITTVVSKSSPSSSTMFTSTSTVKFIEPVQTTTSTSSAFEEKSISSTTSTTSTLITTTSMFGISTQHPSGCSSACDSELCGCIINDAESECMPLLVAECKLDSQSDCLSGIFGNGEVASVFCNSAICLASDKSEWVCRCDFVADLCVMDPKLDFQCNQAECCADATSDVEMKECFIDETKLANSSVTSTSTTSTSTSKASTVKSTATAEPTATTVATSPPFSSEIYKCSREFCQYDLSDDLLLKYKVNSEMGSVEIELLYDGVAWLGFAVSGDGGMVGSEAVIGVPDGSTPKKYYLGGKDTSSVLPMENEKQTLTDASIEVVDDQTIMKFTKLIKELDEVEISTEGNDFLWAHGYGTTLGYHQSRSPFKINLLEISDDVDGTSSTVSVLSTSATATTVSIGSLSSSGRTVSPTVKPVTNPTYHPFNQSTFHPTVTPTQFPTPKPSNNPTASPTLVTHCPPQYNTTDTTYSAGHKIEAGGYVYECKPYPHSLYCSQSEFRPISDEEDEIEMELWLNAWERVGPCYRTESPTSMPTTKKPTINPTITPSFVPTFLPTMKPTAKPSTKPTTNPTTKPTMKPTKQPTQVPTTKPSLKPTVKQTTSGPTESTTELSSYLQQMIQRFPYPYPHVRFTQWAELSDDEKSVAKSLSYTRYLWDNLEIASIESHPYDHLSQAEQQGVGALGLDAEIWDCYVNHYYGYYWDELEDAGVAKYYSALGWTKASWEEGGAEPAIEDLYWNELSETEKENAINLCYFEYSWNWIGLDDW